MTSAGLRLEEALELAQGSRFGRLKTGDRAYAAAARCVRFLGPRRRVAALRPADLARMVAAMGQTGLGPATQNRHLSALSAVLETAGVALDMPWQREPRGRTRWLTHDEVQQLAAACLQHKHGLAVSTLVRFLAETGMRLGEALALTWEDLVLDGLRPQGIIQTSKNGDPRRVPLTQEAVQIVRTRMGTQRGPWHGMSQSVVDHVFRSARDRVESCRGDREVVVHTLRHTAASRLVKAGVSLPIVSAWLGHRSYRSTLRYTHTDEQGLHDAAQKLVTQ